MTDPKGPRDDRWYLSLMSPNTKGPKFAWLDPTSIYINAAAYADLLDDLLADLAGTEFDVVGGCDAMGFVLGAALQLPVMKKLGEEIGLNFDAGLTGMLDETPKAGAPKQG